MNGPLRIGLMLAGLLVLCGCARFTSTGTTPPGTSVTIELSGTPGAPIQGYYIRNGERIELEGALPMTICVPGVSQLAVRKRNAKDRLDLAVSGEGGYSGSSVPPGREEGMWVQLVGGVSISTLPPEESLSAPGNAVRVIAPYWYEGTWVFDDPQTGLVREPFVAGVPEMINTLVNDIPDAKAGFRLTFSASPFPGFQKKLRWVRAESGGNYYRLEDPPLEGWLCPAMFKYFSRAPKELYVKAEPVTR